MKPITKLGTAVALAMVAMLPTMAKADVAVVVGNDVYPNLVHGNLQGCVNDATAMKGTLEGYGFRVILITDDQATKQGILDTLRQVGSQIKSDERFVFYFAGHGSKTPEGGGVLLAHDAVEGNFVNTLNKAELSGALTAISARAKTVVLDACYSDGALRSKGLAKLLHLRFHQMGPKPKNLDPVNQTDTNNNVVNSSVCAFASSTRLQPSGEVSEDGRVRGVFTYCLEKRLKRGHKTDRWGDVASEVSAEVAREMEDQQTPVFGPSNYASVPVFEGTNAPNHNPKPNPKRTLWDDYVENKANTSYLQLRVNPDQSQMAQNTHFNIDVVIGKEDGYLVLLNKDASGRIFLISPNPKNGANVEDMVNASHITAGTTRTITVNPKDLGTERVKAILFHSEAEAKTLISNFPKGKEGASMADLRRILRSLENKGEVDTRVNQWDYVTSMIEVDVVTVLSTEA